MSLLIEIWALVLATGAIIYLWKFEYKWDLINEKYHALYSLTKLDEALIKRGSSFSKLDEFGKRFQSKNKQSRLDRIEEHHAEKASKKEAK